MIVWRVRPLPPSSSAPGLFRRRRRRRRRPRCRLVGPVVIEERDKPSTSSSSGSSRGRSSFAQQLTWAGAAAAAPGEPRSTALEIRSTSRCKADQGCQLAQQLQRSLKLVFVIFGNENLNVLNLIYFGDLKRLTPLENKCYKRAR